MQIPKTQYATLGEDRIAYQAFGEGDVDLVYAPTVGETIEVRWEWPSYATFLRRMASHARVIMFDRRGVGASDAPSGDILPSRERWADEARVVLDTVGSERAVILGLTDSGPNAILFAATHPARTKALILANTTARFAAAPDYPWGIPENLLPIATKFVQENWGTEAIVEYQPDAGTDAAFRYWIAKAQRLSLTPRDASAQFYWEQKTDVRQILKSVRVPTLVLHRRGAQPVTVEQGRYLAEHIAGSRFVELPGNDLFLFTEPTAESFQAIEEFLDGLHGVVEPDRALAAILFTDIVGSTERASALGDREWRHLLETHDAVARTVVEQHRGRPVKTTGDGMLATFDGPGRAIRCAIALGDALRPLGLEIRAGLHTGEVEVMGADIAGIGVHIAARVMEAASAGEVVVSAAVPMLVAGSGFEFDDRGEHELKGIPGAWKLHAVRV
jgi:class 3 adenylate cyclase